jgi:hypothetical protein
MTCPELGSQGLDLFHPARPVDLHVLSDREGVDLSTFLRQLLLEASEAWNLERRAGQAVQCVLDRVQHAFLAGVHAISGEAGVAGSMRPAGEDGQTWDVSDQRWA